MVPGIVMTGDAGPSCRLADVEQVQRFFEALLEGTQP